MGYVAIGLAIISIIIATSHYVASDTDTCTYEQRFILKLDTIFFILLGIFFILLYFLYKAI